jgi:hypothetical protein
LYHFKAKQRVRLVRDAHDLPEGAEGIVIGFYASREAVVVQFEQHAKVVEVRPDEIESLARADQ